MPLAPIADLMNRALGGRDARPTRRYAVGYFESWNLESLQGVVDAAETARAPVILGFNGDFLSRPERCAAERLELYGALGRAAAESAAVPCGLIFNECSEDEQTLRAVTAGFNLVMPVTPGAAYDACVTRVKRIAAYAHAHGVAVQAELGELPCGVTGSADDGGSLTDPQRAADFVAATGVDLLAVSVGNVHILVDGRRPLDLDRLSRIRERVPVPLVLHGGTGIDRASLREAVARGVGLVQFGTGLKQRYLAAVRGALDAAERNPHELLGRGGPCDVLGAGRRAVRDAVLEELEILGSCGKA